MHSSCITTLTNANVSELCALKEVLLQKGVRQWQIQIGMPMGNFSKNDELLIKPDELEKIIDFAYQVMQEGCIDVSLADCMGYFTKKDITIRTTSSSNYWTGCNAGKYSFGIFSNGFCFVIQQIFNIAF